MGRQQPIEEHVPFLPQDDGYSGDSQEKQVSTVIQQTFRTRFYIVHLMLLMLLILNVGWFIGNLINGQSANPCPQNKYGMLLLLRTCRL
jgi:hypothetical protein